MQSRKSGYFLVYRDVWKHPVFKNLVESAIWLYMISSASHKDKTARYRSEEHTSELQSPCNLVCSLLLEKTKYKADHHL